MTPRHPSRSVLKVAVLSRAIQYPHSSGACRGTCPNSLRNSSPRRAPDGRGEWRSGRSFAATTREHGANSSRMRYSDAANRRREQDRDNSALRHAGPGSHRCRRQAVRDRPDGVAARCGRRVAGRPTMMKLPRLAGAAGAQLAQRYQLHRAGGGKPRTGKMITPASVHQQASALQRSARASSALRQFPDPLPLSRNPARPPS
jgi:hypothetical protein